MNDKKRKTFVCSKGEKSTFYSMLQYRPGNIFGTSQPQPNEFYTSLRFISWLDCSYILYKIKTKKSLCQSNVWVWFIQCRLHFGNVFAIVWKTRYSNLAFITIIIILKNLIEFLLLPLSHLWVWYPVLITHPCFSVHDFRRHYHNKSRAERVKRCKCFQMVRISVDRAFLVCCRRFIY